LQDDTRRGATHPCDHPKRQLDCACRAWESWCRGVDTYITDTGVPQVSGDSTSGVTR
jgi:hypothetical protein